MSDATAKPVPIPWWLSRGLVPVAFLVLLAFLLWDRGLFFATIRKEGPLEWVSEAMLLPALVSAFLAWRLRARLPHRWLRVWIGVCVLGCFYYLGEELSWGQHLFRWETPDAIKAVNRQHETNLHQVSSLFGRKPRLLVELWVFIGGILVPLWVRWKGVQWNPSRSAPHWFWPTDVCLWAAVFAVVLPWPLRISRFVTTDPPMWLRLSEVQEYYFAYVLLLYHLSFYLRLKAQGPALDPAGGA